MIVTAFEMWAWEITGWGHIFAIISISRPCERSNAANTTTVVR
jgi:hypothetical protein